MSKVPPKLRYTKTHEWAKQEDDVVIVGITDHAQYMLGDLVYIELPQVETHVDSGQECGLVESVKAAADIYCPVSGEVVEVNEAVIHNPQLINRDPYGRGWLFRVRPFDIKLKDLMNATEYTKQVASEAH